jgi:hypothetical protein
MTHRLLARLDSHKCLDGGVAAGRWGAGSGKAQPYRTAGGTAAGKWPNPNTMV